MLKPKPALIVLLQYVLTLIFVLGVAIYLNEWVFATPPGINKHGFPFAYSWYNSVPPPSVYAKVPPGYVDPPTSGWIAKGLYLDLAFYSLLSVLVLFLLRFSFSQIRKVRRRAE